MKMSFSWQCAFTALEIRETYFLMKGCEAGHRFEALIERSIKIR